MAAQDYQGAAQVYLASMSGLPPDQAGSRQLTAAEYLIRGRQWSQARGLAEQLDPQVLSPVDKDRLKLIMARLSLVEQQADAALQILDEIKAPDLLPDAALE